MPESQRGRAPVGILSVWNDMAAEHQDFYEQWYMNEHFPERLGVPGFRRGKRYEAIDADRRYFTFYELDSPDVLFSDAYLARLNDPTAWTQKIMSVWQGMFRTVCERVARKGAAIGGYAVVARWEAPVDLQAGLVEALSAALNDPSIVGIDLWRASARQNAPTKEAQRRATPDQTITGAVIIETTREANARKAADALPSILRSSGPAIPAPAHIGLYRLIALQDSEV
jgi:hypothetical protein